MRGTQQTGGKTGIAKLARHRQAAQRTAASADISQPPCLSPADAVRVYAPARRLPARIVWLSLSRRVSANCFDRR